MAEQLAHEPKSRDGRIRWWDVVIAFFAGNLAGIALAVVCGLIGVLIAMRYGFRPSVASLTAILRTSFWANQAAIVLSDSGLLAVAWWLTRRRIEKPADRFLAPAGARLLAWAIASGLGLSLLLNGGNELLDRLLHVQFVETDIERVIEPHGFGEFVIGIAVIALFAPFVEEFFFRGMFFAWGERVMGAWPSTLLTALAFAAAHGHLFVHPGIQGWVFTFELFLAGVGLAQWVARTGTLRTSFAAHAAYNANAVAFSVFFP